jgi:hypothetical protein
MYLHRKLENPELMDLLVIHTNRFTQIMIHGETYCGEYEVCKRTIELIQNEIFSRQHYYLKPSFSNRKFDNSSVQHQTK